MTHTMAATPTASPRGRQRRVKCSRTSRLFLCYCAIIGFVLFMGNGIMLPGCQASTSYRHGHTPSPGNIVTTDSKVAQKQYIVCLSTSPQPGNGRGRERDGIAMREGCGKGTGIHLQFPHTRYIFLLIRMKMFSDDDSSPLLSYK